MTIASTRDAGPDLETAAADARPHVRTRRRRSRRARFKHWVRTHKARTVLIVIALLLLALLVSWVVWLNRELGDIDRFPLDLDRDGRPAATAGTNILLLGLDDPDYLDEVGPDMHEVVKEGQWQQGAFRSDTMMVLHIDTDRESAQLVSIPRDSWVTVPGHGKNKINAALSLGGPTLAARTVEDTFDIRLDHVMLLDFQGFRELSTILGGVEVYVAQTVTDSLSGKTWTAGPHRVQGDEALLYVRQRYGLPRGDFDRVQRQQAFLHGVLQGVTSRGTLLNPLKLSDLVDELSELVAVDEEFTNAKIRDLAISSRGLRSNRIRFVTVPNLGTGMAGSASIVRLDMGKARSMFAALDTDRFEGWYAHNRIDEMAPGGVVR